MGPVRVLGAGGPGDGCKSRAGRLPAIPPQFPTSSRLPGGGAKWKAPEKLQGDNDNICKLGRKIGCSYKGLLYFVSIPTLFPVRKVMELPCTDG